MRILFIVAASIFVGCDSKPGGSNSAPPHPTTTTKSAGSAAASTLIAGDTETILAPEEPAESTTLPAAILIVEGGDNDVFYRGWPIRITLRRLDKSAGAPAALMVRGPSEVSPQPAPQSAGVWLIAPDKSAAMKPGNYVFTAGEFTAEIAVADEPAELSADQKEAKQFALASDVLGSGDSAAIERFARDWIKTEPTNPTAHEMLGDALMAAGKTDDAFKSYKEALRRTPPSDQPPSALVAKVQAIVLKAVATMPTQPATTTTADDVVYYKMLDDADALLAAGDFTRAIASYGRAKSYYGNKKLTVGLDEVDGKIAYARQQQALPKTAPASQPAPR